MPRPMTPPAPPLPPLPPSPPLVYSGQPVTMSGCGVESIPFQLNLAPRELFVQADRKTGLFSGDFEVGIQVQPGPTQVRSSGIIDLVSLFATGDSVQFFPQGVVNPLLSSITLRTVPDHWDLQTGFVYDPVSAVTLTNSTPRDQIITLTVQVRPLDSLTQTVASLIRSTVNLRSGSTETIVLALRVTATAAARELITVTAQSNLGAVITPAEIMVNVADTAVTPLFYQVVNPASYSWTVGTTVNVILATAHGVVGTEYWGVDQPQFLVDHGLHLNVGGTLSGVVKGAAATQDLIFWVKKETRSGGRFYAAKRVTITIT